MKLAYSDVPRQDTMSMFDILSSYNKDSCFLKRKFLLRTEVLFLEIVWVYFADFWMLTMKDHEDHENDLNSFLSRSHSWNHLLLESPFTLAFNLYVVHKVG